MEELRPLADFCKREYTAADFSTWWAASPMGLTPPKVYGIPEWWQHDDRVLSYDKVEASRRWATPRELRGGAPQGAFADGAWFHQPAGLPVAAHGAPALSDDGSSTLAGPGSALEKLVDMVGLLMHDLRRERARCRRAEMEFVAMTAAASQQRGSKRSFQESNSSLDDAETPPSKRAALEGRLSQAVTDEISTHGTGSEMFDDDVARPSLVRTGPINALMGAGSPSRREDSVHPGEGLDNEESDAWEWPMSRSEKKARVNVIDRKVSAMQVQELSNEVQDLRSRMARVSRGASDRAASTRASRGSDRA